ncbi:hypothetical protein ACFO4L_11410 [Bacillus daqingensis]|uniref:Lipoprotein n=1 Tax=Bacillus daqingensis TaxID=872396 RepID=A0ABV9NYJ7_9BACI
MTKYLILILLISACQSAETYEGSPLSIAIIGEETPASVEENDALSAERYSLPQFEEERPDGYDAGLILADQLSEAADPVYVAMYEETEFTYVFAESEAGPLPFVVDASYETEKPKWHGGTGLILLKHDGDSHSTLQVPLLDDNGERREEEAYEEIWEAVDEARF